MTKDSLAVSRTLEWPECRNARDLGGLPLTGGGETARGFLVRSDSLSRLTPEGMSALCRYGVRTILDLRETAILSRYPHPLAHDGRFRYLHLPLLPDTFALPVPLKEYAAALDAAQVRIGALVEAIVSEPAATVFHCHSGVGRSGIVSLILLSLAGVKQPALLDDYLQSHCRETGLLSREAASVPQQVIRRINDDGGAAGYLMGAGVDDSDITLLRGRLIGGEGAVGRP